MDSALSSTDLLKIRRRCFLNRSFDGRMVKKEVCTQQLYSPEKAGNILQRLFQEKFAHYITKKLRRQPCQAVPILVNYLLIFQSSFKYLYHISFRICMK